jgi:glucokinase
LSRAPANPYSFPVSVKLLSDLIQVLNCIRGVIVAGKKCVIGVDVGATWSRVASYDISSLAVEIDREPTDVSSSKAVSDQIVRMVRSLATEGGFGASSIMGICIASAGPLSMKEGALMKPPNLPFDYVPLVDPVAKQLKAPTYLVRDSIAGVFGEKKFGAGKETSNLCYVTISTGLGGGAIVDDHLLFGKDGNAAEIGHYIVDSKGRLVCGCGRRGHWEAYCSGKNIPRYVDLRLRETEIASVKRSVLCEETKGKISFVSAEALFEAAKKGDELSNKFVGELGIFNAIGFGNVVNSYDPELVTVGGGVALKNPELILNPVQEHVGEYAINKIPEIRITPLKENVVVYGAIAFAVDQVSKGKTD